MKIKVNFENNIVPDAYSKHAGPEGKIGTSSIISFPFEVTEVPDEAKYLHIVFIDYDAIPVAGFPFIHWTVANVPAEFTSFPENYSRDESFTKLQGLNSHSSKLLQQMNPDSVKVMNNYVGPGAPNMDHDYDFIVYATKEPLNIEEGFFYNDMRKELKGKYIAKEAISFIGRV